MLRSSIMLKVVGGMSVPFGGMLVFSTKQMLESAGEKDTQLLSDNKKLMIYRITGLWVGCVGVIAWYGSTLDKATQTALCRFLAACNVGEIAIKFHALGLSIPDMAANAFGATLMIVGAV